MHKCNRCGAEIQEPAVERWGEWHQEISAMEYRVRDICPYCGSADSEEGNACEICGAFTPKGFDYCDWCKAESSVYIRACMERFKVPMDTAIDLMVEYEEGERYGR